MRKVSINKIVFLLMIALILISCAGLPKPKEDSDSLIVGSFILDFPDGFFWQAPMIVRNDIVLHFVNLNTKEKFSVRTTDGYFHFLSNGRDDFVFESFNYFQQHGGGEWFEIGERPIRRKITNSAHRVIYVGHLRSTYAKPEETKDETLKGEKITYYNYRISFSGESDKKTILDYLKSKQHDSPWLNYEIEDRFEE